MGNLLRTPITAKDEHSGEAHGLSFAVSSMQGYRIEMEVGTPLSLARSVTSRRFHFSFAFVQDAHILQVDIPELPGHSLFTVFDGHGGKTVSDMR